MSENRKKFADYPEVADAIAGREEKVTGHSQTVAKKGSKKVKIPKEEWRRINARCESLEAENQRLKDKKKRLKKEVENLKEERAQDSKKNQDQTNSEKK